MSAPDAALIFIVRLKPYSTPLFGSENILETSLVLGMVSFIAGVNQPTCYLEHADDMGPDLSVLKFRVFWEADYSSAFHSQICNTAYSLRRLQWVIVYKYFTDT